MRTATKKSRTAADIQADIAEHEARGATATADLAKLRARRPAMLLDVTPEGDARLDALELDISRAERKVERASAGAGAIALLEAELDEVRDAEEEARRQAIHARGVAAAAEYRRLAVEDYGPAARAVADVFRAMMAQAEIVEHANNRLPKSAHAAIRQYDAYTPPLYVMARLPGASDREPFVWGST